MAYNGSLFTMGGEEFPHKWIYKDSFNVTPHVLDLDSMRATTGRLQRNVLDHTSVTVTFQTVPMSLEEYEEMWEWIRGKYIDTKARKFRGGYYSFEDGEIKTLDMYVPDVTHNPYWLKNRDGIMQSTTLEFIGY